MKFRLKKSDVDAEQLLDGKILPFTEEFNPNTYFFDESVCFTDGQKWFARTSKGNAKIETGDWVIEDEQGFISAMSKEEFEAAYEPILDKNAQEVKYMNQENNSQLFNADILTPETSGVINARKKPIIIAAIQIGVPFDCQTLEGVRVPGKAGDYLMIGVSGEKYPCDREVFEKSYDTLGFRADVAEMPELVIERITDHKNNLFNRESIEIHTADEKSTDGANHKYKIEVAQKTQSPLDGVFDVEVIEKYVLNFQNGNPNEIPPNGITDQALLAIVLDRLRGFNSGKFSHRDTSIAITHIEDALLRMEKRSNDRARRGVEGTRQV